MHSHSRTTGSRRRRMGSPTTRDTSPLSSPVVVVVVVQTTKRPTMRKRSRSEPTSSSRVLEDREEQQEPFSTQQATIFSSYRRYIRKDVWCSLLLWMISLSLGVTCTSAVSTGMDDETRGNKARLLREKRLEADRKIRERFLNTGDQGCINCIVTFAERPGNVDSSFGSSDFERTNAKALRCVTEAFYNSLFNSPEVLIVELDAKTEPATSSPPPVVENGERVPWGATMILENEWDAIPDPPLSSASDNASVNPITICIVDSGLLVEHQDIPYSFGGPDIKGAEFDLEEDEKWNLPVFYAYHGTHLAGTMVAEGYNGEGLRGIIPRNAGFNLLIARVFGDEMLPSALTSTIEHAVEWCADNGADLVNLSLASVESSINSEEIYRNLVEQENILVVAAAGNRGNSEPSYPASYEHVISVGSIDHDMTRSSYSQYGSALDFVAPGRDIYSTVPSSGVFDNEAARLDAGPMAFTPVPNDLIEGEIHNCGLGDVTCEDASGKVCLMEHTPGISFETMAIHCERGGGIGLIVYPGFGAEDLVDAVMDLTYQGSISVVTVSRDSGLRLLEKRGTHASISFTVPSYREVSGTSMSAAHVTGLLAKLWAARPDCTNAQIRTALEATALDLGDPGRDDQFGHGLVQGAAAYNYLLNQPPPCGSPGGSGSGGFIPDGSEIPTGNILRRKTPRSEHKTRICRPRNHPFCQVTEDSVSEGTGETQRRELYLRHARDHH